MGTVERPPCCWCGQPGAWYTEEGVQHPLNEVFGTQMPMAWCPADKPSWFVPYVKEDDESERD